LSEKGRAAAKDFGVTKALKAGREGLKFFPSDYSQKNDENGPK
jgi:hypothetical protein